MIVMEDGVTEEEAVEVSRQELYEDYVKYYLQCTEVRPCRDDGLMKKAARYFLRNPQPRGTFTMFPFYQAVSWGWSSLSTENRKHLSAFIKAMEMLETICVNLFLQPWRKEITTLKSYTGPFVYCLLPVLSSSTIQSVLASIGYRSNTNPPQSEFKLREDTNPDRAMLMGFELLLARVESSRLLELLDKDQLMLQVLTWMDPLPIVKPQPQHSHLISNDRSIIEMQMTYPDLAFRGRPLHQEKTHHANSSKAFNTTSNINYSDDSKAAHLPMANYIKGIIPAASDNFSKTAEVFGDDDSYCNDSCGVQAAADIDGGRADDELCHPPSFSLHITLRAGSTTGNGFKSRESQLIAEPPACMQQQATAGNTLLYPTADNVASM